MLRELPSIKHRSPATESSSRLWLEERHVRVFNAYDFNNALWALIHGVPHKVIDVRYMHNRGTAALVMTPSGSKVIVRINISGKAPGGPHGRLSRMLGLEAKGKK